MPKFLDNLRQKMTDDVVQENLPTFIDLLIAGIGAVIFFTGGSKGHGNNEPVATTYITNNYYGRKEDF